MAILKLTDICKDYQQGKEPVQVLKNICMTVEKGDNLAIMGPSGSGKTTLMNIVGCLDVPTSGSYELDGRNLKDLSDDDLAEIRNRHIGFVFQHSGGYAFNIPRIGEFLLDVSHIDNSNTVGMVQFILDKRS